MYKRLIFFIAIALIVGAVLSACIDKTPTTDETTVGETGDTSPTETDPVIPEMTPMPQLSEAETDMIMEAYAAYHEDRYDSTLSEESLAKYRAKLECYLESEGMYAIRIGKENIWNESSSDLLMDYWRFHYPDFEPILIFKDGSLYHLESAYSSGTIGKYFVRSLYHAYRAEHENRYDPDPDPITPPVTANVAMPTLTDTEIEEIVSVYKTYYDRYSTAEGGEVLSNEDLAEIRSNIECYGKKDGVYAVRFVQEHETDQLTSYQVNEYWFFFPDIHEILIYYNGELYHPIAAANHVNIIDMDYLASIYDCYRARHEDVYKFFEYKEDDTEERLHFDAISNKARYDSTYYNARYELALADSDCDTIVSILNRYEWKKGLFDGVPDYIFADDDDHGIEYYSQSGMFCYIGYYIKISEEDRLTVNEILDTELEKIDFPPSVDIFYLKENSNAIGRRYQVKSIVGNDLALALIAEIENFKDTGRAVDAIPKDPKYAEYSDMYSAEIGTAWVLCEGETYRISPDRREIALVEGSLGAGSAVSAGENFLNLLDTAIKYYPYDYDIAVYKKSTGELEIGKVYEGETDVKLEIKEIDLQNKTVTLLILPEKNDPHASVSVSSRNDKNLVNEYDIRNLTLEKNSGVTVTLSFSDRTDENETLYILMMSGAYMSYIEIRFES